VEPVGAIDPELDPRRLYIEAEPEIRSGNLTRMRFREGADLGYQVFAAGEHVALQRDGCADLTGSRSAVKVFVYI
jgi:hypothetical protein